MAGKRLKATVVGRVQGVFFRASTEDQAQALGLSGWVRNTEDGAVEVLAEGEEQALQRLLAWLQRGPAGARVERVEQSWANASGRYHGFQVVHRPPAED